MEDKTIETKKLIDVQVNFAWVGEGDMPEEFLGEYGLDPLEPPASMTATSWESLAGELDTPPKGFAIESITASVRSRALRQTRH